MDDSRMEIVACPNEMNKQLRALCTSKISHWKNLNPEEKFYSEPLSGGITNSLYRCWTEDGCSVVVRVFGKNTDSVISREAEGEATRLLAKNGFGKKVLAEFHNGRIEEWISGRSISLEEMRNRTISASIASRLATLHNQVIHSKIFTAKRSSLWETIEDWANKAAAVRFDCGSSQQFQLSLLEIPKRIKQLALTRIFLPLRYPSPVVFSHNDLLSGNIIIDKSEGAKHYIQFIDFEYASYNHRAFDIANHFCEICGFECDWTQFPSLEFQLAFARAYLTTLNAREPLDQEVQALIREVLPWVLTCHLFWGFWSCIQAYTSTIDFNYLEYAQKRFEGFDYHSRTLQIDMSSSKK